MAQRSTAPPNDVWPESGQQLPVDVEVVAEPLDAAPFLAELVVEPEVVETAARLPLAQRAWRVIGSWQEWIFGTASLILGLAVLATIPVLQLLSLGYLLEVSGRVARTGRLREGFIGIRQAARIGSIAFGVWFWQWPLQFAADRWNSARLIDSVGGPTRFWYGAFVVLSVLYVLHIGSACLRGGRLRDFFWPRPILFFRQVVQRGAYARARDAVWDFVMGLRLPYYFWLGVRGFAGAVVWLVVPVTMLAFSSRMKPGPGIAMGLLGGALLTFVLMHLPFLQARFAAENRFGAMFDLRENRRTFARAPIAFWVALFFTLLLALPLYLLKIEIVPREAAWLPSLLFVMSIFPARLMTGWACGRAARRTTSRHWFWRLGSRLAMFLIVVQYVFLVYFTQYLSWYGVWSLYEQHAFLLPVPFLGL